MYKVSQLLLTIGLCAAVSTATAGDVQKTKTPGKYTTVVRFGDLNLDTEQGAEKLYSRLRVAAHDVCGARNGLVPLELRVREKRCIRDAIADAVAKANRSQLTAYHQIKIGAKNEQVLSKL